MTSDDRTVSKGNERPVPENASLAVHELLARFCELASGSQPDSLALPWADSEFSDKWLQAAASTSFLMPSSRRYAADQDLLEKKVPALLEWSRFEPGHEVIDAYCGNGHLLGTCVWQGAIVTGVDVAPAAIKEAWRYGVGTPCTFACSDFMVTDLPNEGFDVGLLLHGQIALNEAEKSEQVLGKLRRLLRPGGALAVEVLDRDRIQHATVQTWVAGKTAWGEGMHLVLSQREWCESEGTLLYSQYVFDGATGQAQAYREVERILSVIDLQNLLNAAGFSTVEVHQGWDGRLGERGDPWLLMIAQ